MICEFDHYFAEGPSNHCVCGSSDDRLMPTPGDSVQSSLTQMVPWSVTGASAETNQGSVHPLCLHQGRGEHELISPS